MMIQRVKTLLQFVGGMKLKMVTALSKMKININMKKIGSINNLN